MNIASAAAGESLGWMGLVVAGALVVAFIVNIVSFGNRDMNQKSSIATSLMLIAFLLETASWTVRSFRGGTANGVFVTIVLCAVLHVVSGSICLGAVWEFRTIGRWPYGHRRATLGFWLNVIALVVLAAWFYLATSEKLYNRLFN